MNRRKLWKTKKVPPLPKTVRLLAADIHLSAAGRCVDFLAALSAVRDAKEIYLLGDIFDAWLGDDENEEWAVAIIGALAATVQNGTAVFVMRGNRDFLLGKIFCRQTGCQLLPDFHIIENNGRRLLLTHGDILCAESAYMLWRKIAHHPLFAAVAVCFPLLWRRRLSNFLRGQSKKRRKKAEIDLQQATAFLQKYQCQTLIHGHTHLSGKEMWQADGEQFLRICLPDWEGNGGRFCELDEEGNVL